MNWFQKVWDTYQKGLLYDNLLESKTEKDQAYIELENNITQLKEQIAQGVLTQEELQEKVEQLQQYGELEKYWTNKHPQAIITYKGRYLPNSSTRCKVPVNVLVTPYDPYIIRDLKSWGLYQNGEDPETLIPKIYKKIYSKYYKYAYDKQIWAAEEVWELPFEMREKGFKQGFDCDSWGNFQISYYLAAGVPEWMVRGVYGDTKIGGHHTVYVLSLKDFKHHHLNSTYGFIHKNVSDFPTHDDAESGKDRIGVYNVWGSYTYKSCYSKFEDEEISKEIKGLIIQKV